MAILGLLSSSALTATQSEHARRKIFYQYPQGPAPLMGLLSMMEDGEPLDKTLVGWWEKRFVLPKQLTVSKDGTNGPFTDTSGTNLTTGGWSIAKDASFRIYVVDASSFLIRDIVWAKDTPGTASSKVQVRGIVTAIDTTNNFVTVRAEAAIANALNDSTTIGLSLLAYSSAAAEGDNAKTGRVEFPIEVTNYNQIFRTAVGPFTGNALKLKQRFDSTGMWKTTVKEQALRHMGLMEHTAFFGQRGQSTVVNYYGDTVTENRMGGLLWYLQQWELGNTVNTGQFNYRPGGADLTPVAWNGDNDKRILKINASISGDQFEQIIANAFRRTGNTSFEKIFFCGQGVLQAFNRYAKTTSLKVVDLSSKEDTYGMKVTSWETVHGTLHFKGHPLFIENPMFANSGFIVDVQSLMYHPVQDRDTQLLKNRQPPDADFRKDEWFSDWSLEMKYPERHMFIDGLLGINA